MEILYTEITQDLTAGLLEIASKELALGRKIFYIVPSSMSFEKEKEILMRLAQGSDTAVFDLLVTRFKQLPYYFDKREHSSLSKVELSQAGFSMLFRKMLREFSKEELPLYFSLQNSSGFLEMLVNLRAELLTANLTAEDLPDSAKNRELKLILSAFETELMNNYANFSEFGEFTARVAAGEFDEQLSGQVMIVDGYTRFSAEEEAFISAVQNRVASFIVGTYASKKDLTGLSEPIYAHSTEMIQRFKANFAAQVHEISKKTVNLVYSKLTELIKQEQSFVLSDKVVKLEKDDAEQFTIWEAENQTAEVERVAKEIRQKLVEGVSFKDFTVLVGDMNTYEILIKEIFALYEIPFFYAQEESMSQHPLIVFFESLFAIKKNNYRTDDVVNLLKSKVYSSVNFEQDTVDYFEYYVQKFKIAGRKKFATVFDENEFLQLKKVENLRIELLGDSSPLQLFLSGSNLKTGKSWIDDLQKMFENGNVLSNMNKLYEAAEYENNPVFADKHEQVWKTFSAVLSEFLAVFSNQKMKILEFLEIILSGLKNANYRQIPANVDVVNIKDYELVEPRTNEYVYAIGLSQTNFPRIKKNSTLLSDEERAEINAKTSESQFIEQLNVVNYHKNTLTVLSLVNSAKKQLVLSMPQIMANTQDEVSPVLQLFMEHADKEILQKIRAVNLSESLEHVGNTRAVIATIGQIERQLSATSEKSDKSAFWFGIFRILSQSNPDFRRLLGDLDKDILPVNLADETVNQVYKDKIYASVSSFERLYNCEYQYFLENTLGLETFENIDINSKIVGNFFHEVFEKLLNLVDLSSSNFDERLTAVLHEVDSKYERYFKQDATARFTWSNLEEIVRQTSIMLKKSISNTEIKTLMTESSFGLPQSELGDFTIDNLQLRGRIDRVDELFLERLGAVDYKSSAHSFRLQDAYDGMSLQFLTYLDVLKKAYPQQKIWGALYLQFKNSPINLNDVNSLSEIGRLIDRAMSYEGLILEDAVEKVKQIDSIYVNKNNVYNENEFNQLLVLNEQHYHKAGQRLTAGKIAINPVMKSSDGIDKSGNVQGCRYCPLKSICRFEANIHMNNYSREIGKKSRAEIMAELKGEK